MNIKSFIKLVEIQTKLASMIPLLLGTFYAVFHFRRFNTGNFLMMFVSILAFDMVTTALNNYFDYKRANKKHGYNYETHNAIANYGLKESMVLSVIAGMLLVAAIAGILLFIRTDIVVLVIGVVSFGVGVSYSFGPVPISRTPLGEALSGFFMGFVIVFLSMYIHVYDMGLIAAEFTAQAVTLRVNFIEMLYISAISVPAMFGIANIMLANNICDISDDIENRRYTLPVYIGKKYSLMLFKSLYYISFLTIIIVVVFKLLPVVYLLVLLSSVPVHRNIKTFEAKQTKKDTFGLSVQNFLLISGGQVAVLAALGVFA